MALKDFLGYRIIDLEFVREVDMPAMPTHKPPFSFELVHPHEDSDPKIQGVRTSAWGSIIANEHSGTHVDAFCHQAESGVMHGGFKVSPETETRAGFTVNGAENLPIFFDRGILLDVAALKGVNSLEPNYRVTAKDLSECCRVQNTKITEGCVALVNLGNAQHWNDRGRYLNCPGMSAEASQMLADKRVRAVGADNFGWDEPTNFVEEMHCNGPGHVILIVRNGINIFENLNLTELAASGAHEFIFVAAPIRIKGATGGSVRPLALITE